MDEGGIKIFLVAVSGCIQLIDLLLEMGIPIVLDVIVCSLRKVGSYGCPPTKKMNHRLGLGFLLPS